MYVFGIYERILDRIADTKEKENKENWMVEGSNWSSGFLLERRISGLFFNIVILVDARV